jgi:hypothetical protein
MDQTQKRRPTDLRLPDRREDASALEIGRAAATSFAAPTSISSPLATASLCAGNEPVADGPLAGQLASGWAKAGVAPFSTTLGRFRS